MCTLGPACSTKEQIQELAKAGMSVARINLSHGSREDHVQLLQYVQSLSHDGCCIPSLFDTRGAEIRTGDVSDPIAVTKGQTVLFVPPTGVSGDEDLVHIHVRYNGFADDVAETERILVDNGEMDFSIDEIRDNGTVLATAKQSGEIGSRRHINLPGADVDLPSVTEKDWDDIDFASQNDVDFVALSFIRRAEEVEEVRERIQRHGGSMQIITKIETQLAVENLEAIVDASDGIMVARGDLGSEVPFEKLPVIQQRAIDLCREAGKPVIVATHMLESMKRHPIPTRAEVTDVAHAAMQQTDATMLSGETASGKHPSLAIEAMSKILWATEGELLRTQRETSAAVRDDSDARAHAAVELAIESEANAIIVMTKSGCTARLISKYRPHMPIIAITDNAMVQRQLHLSYGVISLCIDAFADTEETVQNGLQKAQEAGLIHSKDEVIVVSDAPTSSDPVTSIQSRII